MSRIVFGVVAHIFERYIPALVIDGVSASLNLQRALRVDILTEKIKALARLWKENHSNPRESYVIIELEGEESRQRFIVNHVDFDGNHLVLSYNPEKDRVVNFCHDVHPQEGEYWSPNHRYSSEELIKRGYIKGFVSAEICNIRLTKMVENVTGRKKNGSHMIQDNMFIFRGSEFDLPMLINLSENKGGIITQDILEKCKKWKNQKNR